MGKYLNAGNDGFAAAVKGIYVDKTELIPLISSKLGTWDNMICVSRPRRFGKSLTADMLCAYYSKGCDFGKLFEGLKVSKDPSFEKHLNKYNVIYLDITLFISKSFDIRHVVKDMENAVIKELQQTFPDAAKDDTLADMFFNAAQAVGEKFIMIIDEWGALFREAKEDTSLQKEYIDLDLDRLKEAVIGMIGGEKVRIMTESFRLVNWQKLR